MKAKKPRKPKATYGTTEITAQMGVETETLELVPAALKPEPECFPVVRCSYSDLADPKTLVPHPENPNRHPAKQLAYYRSVIEFQGWRRPITVSVQSGMVTRGHGALETALAAGWALVPVDYQNYTSAEEELADLVADNSLQRMSEMDTGKLTELVVYFRDSHTFDMPLLGLEDRKVERLLSDFDARNPDMQGVGTMPAPEPPQQPAAFPLAERGTEEGFAEAPATPNDGTTWVAAPAPASPHNPEAQQATGLIQFFLTNDDKMLFAQAAEHFAGQLDCSVGEAVLQVLLAAYKDHTEGRSMWAVNIKQNIEG